MINTIKNPGVIEDLVEDLYQRIEEVETPSHLNAVRVAFENLRKEIDALENEVLPLTHVVCNDCGLSQKVRPHDCCESCGSQALM